MEMDSFRVQPSVVFKVEKIIGVSVGEGNMRNYQVQWAPTWVSGLHLVGCEHMIDEFLQAQENKSIEQSPTVEVGKSPPNNDVFWNREMPEKMPEVVHARNYVFERASMVVDDEPSDNHSRYSNSEQEITSVEIIDDLHDCNVGVSNEFMHNGDQPNPNFQWMEDIKNQDDNGSGLSFPYGDPATMAGDDMKTGVETGPFLGYNDSNYNSDHSTMKLEHIKSEPTFHDQYTISTPGHSALRPNEHECHECHKLFTTVSELKKHIKLHTGNKPYQCGVCRKTFTTKGSLKMHYELHSGIKRHQCRVCNKVFSQKHYLKSHERQHAGDNPFNCMECGKSFTSKVNLETHFRLHTGEKPYRCTICDKRFTQKGNLQSHVSRIHKDVKVHEQY